MEESKDIPTSISHFPALKVITGEIDILLISV